MIKEDKRVVDRVNDIRKKYTKHGKNKYKAEIIALKDIVKIVKRQDKEIDRLIAEKQISIKGTTIGGDLI